MKYLIFLVILFAGIISDSFAQTRDNHKLVRVVKKAGYIYIPTNVFYDTISALIDAPFFGNKKHCNKEISLSWQSDCIDGSYSIIITPEQIYLRSIHNNPNPSFIFWVINIDSLQYLQFDKALRLNTPKGFKLSKRQSYFDAPDFWEEPYKDSFKLPDNSNDSIERDFWNKCNKQREYQVTKYFDILNSCITVQNSKIIFLDNKQIENQNRKYIGALKQEIIDWLPFKKGTIIE